MRKILIILGMLLLFATQAHAAWTITTELVDVKGSNIYIKVNCVSDGDALTATDFVQYADEELMRYLRLGATMMVMDVVPGTGAAAPTGTINITISNIEQLAVYTDTGISNVANTLGQDLSVDYTQYPSIDSKMYITLNDIGNAADSVAFYFKCWVPVRR
jgi:hypothetical protein